MNSSNESVIIHDLDPYAEMNGETPAIEYILPSLAIPSEVRNAVQPWIQELIGLTPRDVRTKIEQQWAHIERPPLAPLKETLLRFEPFSITIHNNCGWLRIVAPGYDIERTGASFFLAPLLSRKYWQRRVKKLGLAEYELLLDFLANFAGIRANIPTEDGAFLYDERWRIFNEAWMKKIHGFSDWKGALVIYGADNGDAVLLHQSGKVGWWVFDAKRTRIIARDFEGFLECFIQCCDQMCAFNSYSMP